MKTESQKPTTALILGAGSRGALVYAGFALSHPYLFKVTGVAEPIDERRKALAAEHHIDPANCFTDWREALAGGRRIADVVCVCTQDQMHVEPVLAALELGYHVLLEKPMATNAADCMRIVRAVEKSGSMLSIAHVLRYTPFFQRIRHILDSGMIGRLVSIQHNENVGYFHYSHSYVRGNWRRADQSSPMILAKSCHDLDILRWLAGSPVAKLSSFGSLLHFTSENRPVGAPDRCLDNCPHHASCPYYAPKIYLTGNTGWPVNVISLDTSFAMVYKALQEGPYGRCVYACDNDVVDHQVVSLEFDNAVTAVFTMGAFNGEGSRTIKLMGTKGELHGHFEKGEIIVQRFGAGEVLRYSLTDDKAGHGGGDDAFLQSFLQALRLQNKTANLTDATESLESHLMAFMAEEARLSGKVVEFSCQTQIYHFPRA